MTMKGKHRKKGDWKVIANGRNNRPRDFVNGNGLSNIPRITDVGSAAYRRLTGRKGNG